MIDTSIHFDYAPILMNMEKLQRKIHDLILDNKTEETLPLVLELIHQAGDLKNWTENAISKS